MGLNSGWKKATTLFAALQNGQEDFGHWERFKLQKWFNWQKFKNRYDQEERNNQGNVSCSNTDSQ